uniref:Galectin domain-containing protein n=1 Tax=Globodera pallida TaxID=36090 RepID=A0A183BJS1_GLOPA
MGSGPADDGLDKYLEVEVVPRKYFYEVKIGDRKVFNYFPRSSDWWAKGTMEDITRVEITGDVYPESVDVPKVGEKPKQSAKPDSNSYVTRFDQLLENGDQIVIRGQIGKPQNSQNGPLLFIGLLHNTPGFNQDVSTMAWYLIQEQWKLKMGHYNPKVKYVEHAEAHLDLFNVGEAFEIRIELVEANNHTESAIYEFLTLVISVFTPSRTSQTNFSTQQLNFRDVNFITVKGDLELFADPFISNFFEKNKKLSWDVYPLLVVGDSIFIEGKLFDNATYLQINLLHDANEQNPYVGDVVLQLVFDFTGNGTITMKAWPHEQTLLPILIGDKYPSTLFPGEQFKIEIRVAFDRYNIFVYGALAANYFHVLPSWAVDYMNVNGHFSQITKFAVNRTNGIFCAPEERPLDLPFVMEVPDQKMLSFNDSITIHGIVTKKNAKITVLLLNEAVETYDNVAPSMFVPYAPKKIVARLAVKMEAPQNAEIVERDGSQSQQQQNKVGETVNAEDVRANNSDDGEQLRVVVENENEVVVPQQHPVQADARVVAAMKGPGNSNNNAEEEQFEIDKIYAVYSDNGNNNNKHSRRAYFIGWLGV